MDSTPPPFFNRGPAPFVRLMFFGLLAVLLMVLDARFKYTEPMRQVIAVIAYPLQQLAISPVRMAQATFEYFTSKSALEREISELRSRHLQSAQDLLALEALAEENAQLRRLMEAREKSTRKSMMAEILYAGRDPFSRKVVVDRGTSHGVLPGQAVIDEQGVVGQVTRVHPMLSEVTLVTDKNQAIPVQVVRNGLRAVVFGSGDGETLDLRYMAANADIQNGDLLVTSGIDGTYPEGLPVARVSRVERDASYTFAKISCLPAAGAGRHRQVLVLQHDPNLPPAPDEMEPEKAKPSKGRRPRARSGA
jgi:rod shape-determining protein MreC